VLPEEDEGMGVVHGAYVSPPRPGLAMFFLKLAGMFDQGDLLMIYCWTGLVIGDF
jgi:hypothetical protein